MSGPERDIAEDELHAFADGSLPPERQAAVAAWLAAHPAEAAAVEAWREQNARLRAAYEASGAAPLPDRLSPVRIAAGRRRTDLRRLALLAAGLVLFALGFGTARLMPPALPVVDANRVLAGEALSAHRVYVVEVRHPVEVPASEEAHLVAWLSKRLGQPLKAPDLTGKGYRLIGGRLLPANARPAAHFMYENADKKRLTLYLKASAEPGEVAFRILEEAGFTACYWLDSPFGYALIAEADRETVLGLARLVHAQLNP